MGRWILVAILGIASVAVDSPVADGGQRPAPHSRIQACRDSLDCPIDNGNVVFSLPPSVAHYPCDGNGQAPAGALDETSDLQAWIDKVSDGKGARDAPASIDLPHIDDWHVLDFPDARCLRVDGSLSISDRKYLIFKGDGVTIDQHLKPPYAAFNGMAWSVFRGSHLQWWGFKILGNHSEKQRHPADSRLVTKVSAYGYCHDDPVTRVNESSQTCEWQGGWGLYGAQHIRLEGNQTRNTHGDSIEIGWDLPNQPPKARDTRDVIINNHKVYGTGRQGVSAVSSQYVTVSNSYIEGAAQVGLDLEPEHPLLPIRRWTIRNNDFGQSYGSIAQLGAPNTCTEVSEIIFSGNQQLEPNITSWPALIAERPTHRSPNSPCTAQRGPLAITHNDFWVEEWDADGDILADFRGYSNVVFSSNAVRLSCYPGTGCVGDQTPVSLRGGSGHVLNANNFAVPGWRAWSSVYRYGDGLHGSLGNNVSSCGNTTSRASYQPIGCPP